MNALRAVRRIAWLALVFSLMMVACGVPSEEAPLLDTQDVTNTPSIVVSDTPELQDEVAGPKSSAPTPLPGVAFNLPSSPFQIPLGLVGLQPSNISMLEPFGLLTFDMISTFIPDASLVSMSKGSSLAAHFDDGALAVWDVATGDVVGLEWSKRGGGHTGSYAALEVSPESDAYLATSATVYMDDTGDLRSAVYLWEMDGLGEPVMLPGTGLYGDRYIDPMGVMSLAYSPDGSLLAAGLGVGEGQGGTVRIWDVSEKAVIQELNFEGAVSDVSFSPDKGLLLVSSDTHLIYVDPISGEELQEVELEFSIHGQVLSPSGNWLAIYGDQFALLELASGELTFALPSTGAIRAVAFSRNESLLAIAEGNHLRFWNLDTRGEVASYQGEIPFLDVVFLQSESVIATVDEQSQVLLWGVRGP